MRAKLLTKVKIMKDEKVVDCNFTKGKIYEIKNTDFFFYYICNDLGVLCRLSRDLFEIVEEDKMEQVKIVRKLEDLDGNISKCEEFVLNYYRATKSAEIIFKGDKNIMVTEICEESFKIYTETRNLLKKLGFEFQYKPLRTVEEVKREFIELTKNRFCTKTYKYLVIKHDTECSAENYYYYKDCYREVPFGKACWLTEEEARNYSEELNEIIGVGR